MQPLSLERTYRVVLPAPERLNVILVGVGGTGSALAPALARLAVHARHKGLEVGLSFVDHDHVEAKNIAGRQNFCPAEIGEYKCVTMALRLNAALGLGVTAVPEPFEAEMVQSWWSRRDELVLIVGAVDNYRARREMARAVAQGNGRLWALDLGNDYASGQIVLGNLVDLERIWLSELGLCSGLPSPYLQEPDLLDPEEVESPLSCADLVRRQEQGLAVNQMAAAIAAQYCVQVLVEREIRQMATTFTLEPPTTKSRRITAENLERIKSQRQRDHPAVERVHDK